MLRTFWLSEVVDGAGYWGRVAVCERPLYNKILESLLVVRTKLHGFLNLAADACVDHNDAF